MPLGLCRVLYVVGWPERRDAAAAQLLRAGQPWKRAGAQLDLLEDLSPTVTSHSAPGAFTQWKVISEFSLKLHRYMDLWFVFWTYCVATKIKGDFWGSVYFCFGFDLTQNDRDSKDKVKVMLICILSCIRVETVWLYRDKKKKWSIWRRDKWRAAVCCNFFHCHRNTFSLFNYNCII